MSTYFLLQYPQNRNVGPNWRAGGPLAGPWHAKRENPFLSSTSLVAKHKKLKGDPLVGIFFKKKSHNAKKLKGVTLWDFSTSILSQNINKLKGDPLVSPGIVCYVENEEKLFWFSSLGQMNQFETIKFCKTFNNYFGQFVWIEKKESL